VTTGRRSELVAGLGELPVANVRGRGLLVGFETAAPAGEVVEAARDEGLLVLTAGDRVVRLAPPLTVSDDEIVAALDVLTRVVTLQP
jgi:acetylornithine/N-succinyldiaminopimelate aminotransferase